MKVFISVINYNSRENTLACLESLGKVHVSGFDLEIIVIDNASKEPFTLDTKDYPNLAIHFIKSEKNLGFAGGHNLGISYALKNDADYIIILNNDTYVKATFIDELLSVAKIDEKIAVISPKIYFAPGFEFHKDRYKKEDRGRVFWYAGGILDWNNLIGRHRGVDEVDHGQHDTDQETDFATGCCMLLRIDALKKAKLLDDRYFLYYEDSDLQERIKRLGYKVYYAPRSVIWHKNAGSSGGSGSALHDYYISRNRLLFGYLYAPLKTKFALLRESIKLILKGRKWQKIGVRDFYLGRFGKGSFDPESMS